MAAKIKVLHLSQDTGGVKTYVAHILNHADADKFDFAVAAPENELFEAFCSQKNVPYYRVNLHRGNNPVTNISALRAITAAIKREKPDIIHAHSAKGGFLGRLAARFTGQKVIYTPHAFSYLPFTGFKRMAFFSLELMVRRWTDVLLAISHSEANRAIHELGFDKRRVKTILNAIPLPAAKPPATYAGDKIRIRMIGRLTPQKNHLLFLEIAKNLLDRYPALEFSILGAGIHDELSDSIRAYLDENGLAGKITIHPWGDAATSGSFLANTDIFVMTSVFEGLPFSLLEAMSLEIPCVVSKVDGNTDVIQNGENGFSCLSVTEFCSKIEMLVNDAALRQRIGKSAAQYVAQHHDISKNIVQLENLYSTVHTGGMV